MKSRLAMGIVVFVLVLAGVSLGGVIVRLVLPSTALFGSNPASAQGLTAQAAGPLIPSPVGSGFTYQGSLKSGGSPANGSYDFQFSLYDAPISGTLVVTTPITITNQAVSDGLFTVPLDFGSSA